MLFTVAATLALLSTSALAALGPNSALSLSHGHVAPDGVDRIGVLVNNEFPSPLIQANKSDEFRLNVIDQLTVMEDPYLDMLTSIHWHGFFQKGSNYADGPAYVTQCPLVPGENFLYQFQIPDQVGTYWYHSHFALQYCDGLRGPIVVYDPDDPYKDDYDVDDESTVITLADWYHTAARAQPAGPFFADSTLINGKGRSLANLTAPLSVIQVERNKRYRFRLVSLACEPNYTFSIDGHNMTIIEADGELTEPHTVNQIQIFAGQRYSFILNATQPKDNYWIRSTPSLALKNSSGTDDFTGGINSAILRYIGASEDEPITNASTEVTPLREADLHALIDPAAPGGPDYGHDDVQNVTLVMAFDGEFFTINGNSFTPNATAPFLLQILSGVQRAQDLLPQESIVNIERGRVIEVTLLPNMTNGMAGTPHPMHLHGHAFSVVRSAGETEANYVNPVRRDVVNTGTAVMGEEGAGAVIRFVADNPGPWFLHCHIDPHLQAGLAVVFAEDVEQTAGVTSPPQDWSMLCPVYNSFMGVFNRPFAGPTAEAATNSLEGWSDPDQLDAN
ncbi:multicopper oxidase/laccase [Schizophyllum amplum]|uniref:Multicopper oxidase/laccase n=1 Tax=Schizophyllum amplum TaxID=97359 RepID=A0A550D058_9AGAR|nr:multicopper oxidase/laccase [Auriculariopsis ampla]